MLIEITGYVTQAHGAGGFTIKITHDNVKDEKGNHPEVSKEKRILIARHAYPDDNNQQFEKVEADYQKDRIDECVSISKGLKKGDQVKCYVCMVDTRSDSGETTYTVINNPNDIETYTKFDLWLYPDDKFFERLEVDTPQTLKFRKQNYYMDINKTKYEKITGNRYQNKWWMNKNPQIIFPILGWIRIKTRASNLWKRFGEQDNLLKASIIINIILALITIWSFFFKKN